MSDLMRASVVVEMNASLKGARRETKAEVPHHSAVEASGILMNTDITAVKV